MSTHRSAGFVGALALLATALLCGSQQAPAEEKAPSPGGKADAASAFDIVPTPSQLLKQPLTLVGLSEDKKTGVALSVVLDGPAVGYVCNGKDVAVWFQGSCKVEDDRITLKSDDGDTLSAEWSAKGTMSGEATVAGTRIKFKLDPSTSAGLAREVKTVDGEKQVGGWIFTNSGQIIGAKTARKRVVEGTNSAAGTAPPASGGKTGGNVAATAARKRCEALLFRINLNGVLTGTLDNRASQRFQERFDKLGCDAVLNGSPAQ